LEKTRRRELLNLEDPWSFPKDEKKTGKKLRDNGERADRKTKKLSKEVQLGGGEKRL